jgi:hypothetical protein
MSMDLNSWTKYTYSCDPNECDSLIEYTCKDTFGFPSGSVMNITCPCGRKPNLLSVQDATIGPLTTNPKGTTMETATLNEQIKNEYDLLYGNRITELENELSAIRQNREYYLAENGRVQGQIIDVVDEIQAGNWTDVDDIANTLCEIIDYNPVKEIEFTATIRFTGRMEVPVSEYNNGFDISDALSDAYVDINNGDIIIDQYDIEDAEEC